MALIGGSRMAQRREDNKRSCVHVLLHVYVQILMHVCAGVHAIYSIRFDI